MTLGGSGWKKPKLLSQSFQKHKVWFANQSQPPLLERSGLMAVFRKCCEVYSGLVVSYTA